MKCPMRFGGPRPDADEVCVRSECAWWVIKEQSKKHDDSCRVEACAVAFSGVTGPGNGEDWVMML